MICFNNFLAENTRTIIQRVARASVTIGGVEKSRIDQGLLLLLGVEDADTQADIDWLAQKVSKLRIFNDEKGVMNRSVLDIGGELLVVSQFTLHASTRKGNRPSYIKAARPEVAVPLYEAFVSALQSITKKPVQTGEFGADMKVELLNDGPVTLFIDTKQKE